MRGLVLAASVVLLIWGCGLVPPAGGGGPDQTSGPPDGANGGSTPGSGAHLETGGRVVVEAEHFSQKGPEPNDRQWYAQAGGAAGPGPDPDGFHDGASGNSYMECLPDTRVTEGDPLGGGAFHDSDTRGARLEYEIIFETAGTYFVWVRAYSTGTEDNGLHVGVDGDIQSSGKKMQWCGTGQWSWSSAQRDSGGSSCGQDGTITINIPSAGSYTIKFYQREDGFEFDRFLLTTDGNYDPDGAGPVESPRESP